jgi:hypothetical protein
VTEEPNQEKNTEARKDADGSTRLGGRRKSKIDDNADLRKWQADAPEAGAFWMGEIRPLDKERRKQVEFFLPSINIP